jgi:uncharacterized oligopeptide transporter (OPT) family protein
MTHYSNNFTGASVNFIFILAGIFYKNWTPYRMWQFVGFILCLLINIAGYICQYPLQKRFVSDRENLAVAPSAFSHLLKSISRSSAVQTCQTSLNCIAARLTLNCALSPYRESTC